MKRSTILLLSFVTTLFSCTHVTPPPDGFAAYNFDDRFEAVSPEGMRYRARVVKNEPVQTLGFWSEALNTHLRKEGYIPLGEAESFSVPEYDGIIHEWALSYGHESYIYMTALAVSDSRLAIVESAAEQTVYRRHRSAVVANLNSIDFNRMKITPASMTGFSSLPEFGAAKTTGSFRPSTSSSGGCFPVGTLVVTPHGTQTIEQISAGDLVWSSNQLSDSWELKPVTRMMSHTYSGAMITLTTSQGTVKATGNHPFWIVRGKDLELRPVASDVPAEERSAETAGRWIEADDLQSGDVIRIRNGTAMVASITAKRVLTTVYNLTVADYHTYSVGSAGFLVHNKGSQESGAALAGYAETAPESSAPAAKAVTGTTAPNEIIDELAIVDRKRIYSGACSLLVDDITETKNAISVIAEEAAGYVEAIFANSIVIRVPAVRFDSVYEEVLKQGDILNKRLETFDVTEYFIDTKIRLELSEKARERLYALLEKTEDVEERLKILREIGRLTEEIENIRSALATLEHQIEFSRISVNLQLRRALVQQDKQGIPFGWIARLEPLYPSVEGNTGNITLFLEEDIAVFDDKAQFRAEGAEGTRIRLGKARNLPRGGGGFWQNALIHHLSPFYAESRVVNAGDFYGALFTSKDRKPFLYFVAVLDRGDSDELAVFETFFPDIEAYERRIDSILAALEEAEVTG